MCLNATIYRYCQVVQYGEIDLSWPRSVFLGQVCINDVLPISVAGALQHYGSAGQILFSFTPVRSQNNYNDFSEIVLATDQCKW